MTEKRFTHKKWYNERRLFDGDEPFAIVDVYIQAEAICDKLNGLHKKNKELQKENNILIKQKLGEEQLKQEIADYHTSNGKLHRRVGRLIRRLDEFHIEYKDILYGDD